MRRSELIETVHGGDDVAKRRLSATCPDRKRIKGRCILLEIQSGDLIYIHFRRVDASRVILYVEYLRNL